MFCRGKQLGEGIILSGIQEKHLTFPDCCAKFILPDLDALDHDTAHKHGANKSHAARVDLEPRIETATYTETTSAHGRNRRTPKPDPEKELKMQEGRCLIPGCESKGDRTRDHPKGSQDRACKLADERRQPPWLGTNNDSKT